jgi:hypothetical protein
MCHGLGGFNETNKQMQIVFLNIDIYDKRKAYNWSILGWMSKDCIFFPCDIYRTIKKTPIKENTIYNFVTKFESHISHQLQFVQLWPNAKDMAYFGTHLVLIQISKFNDASCKNVVVEYIWV